MAICGESTIIGTGDAGYISRPPPPVASIAPDRTTYATASPAFSFMRVDCPSFEIAAQLGHSPTMTLNTYGHVIAELKGSRLVSAERQIRDARRRVSGPKKDPAKHQPRTRALEKTPQRPEAAARIRTSASR